MIKIARHGMHKGGSLFVFDDSAQDLQLPKDAIELRSEEH